MSPRPLNRAWRIVVTGFSFAVFGITALLLSITLFPLIALIERRPVPRRERIQRTLHGCCRWFVGMMRFVGILTWEVHGAARLTERGRMIVANHPSLIDAVFLLSWMPQADCIVKQALLENPFLRWTIRWAGFIGNADPDDLIRDCAGSLRAGRSLIVFPEGTRSVPGRAPSFKRGAARIALAADAELLPVQISCVPIMLTKQSAWWRVPERAPHYCFMVGEPFRAAPFAGTGETPAIAARRLTAHLQALLVPPD